MIRLVAIAAAFTVGCVNLNSGSWGGSGGGSSHTTDQGTVHRGISVLTHNNRTYLVLLSTAGEATAVNGGPGASGTIVATDQRKVRWTCHSQDTKTGDLTIAGTKLRLENGGVVLVDLRGGGLVIKQAAVDLGTLSGGSVEAGLKALAQANEQVAEFLQACESPK